ncbi:carbohydrate ABC transporter permease [Deinococcus maricopensis]|uniref:ABC-type transporter, integral membrane subunit n=1 Tax=Deinococcus maricopensis (strain DSM 21211 / LMG 22137 / NRRL B-23946 / LB-34) TaxID=709986 RepID=E8UAK4_DEIML|nr:carbohydrate ABC transporter permease [Deinococcus maricopensis]ADV68093.1 ABC-type transporter, integral membrane subunit [Deinococcus maricopensis DSM 21211]
MTTTPAPKGVTAKSSNRPRMNIGRPLMYLGLIIAALFFLTPIYLLIITALKTPESIDLATTWQFPRIINWASFSEAWAKIGGNLGNSLFLAVTATLLSAVIGSLNGYALSKWKFRGANTLFALMLFGMFIPYQSVLIPLFEFVKSIGLYGSIWALVLAHVVYGLPITTLIFRNFYADVPDALIEAATIDGAGFWSIYSKVIFPISIPGFVVVIIWQFTQVWNEFLFAATLTSPSSQPVTYALSQLAGGQAVSWNLPMAGAILAALPTLLVYILLGRYFVRGLLAGSVKG